MGLQAVLFDIDGTLLDTREFIYGAFEHTCRANGLAIRSREEMAVSMGRPLEQIYGDWSGGRSTEMVEMHRTFQAENLHLSRTFAGAPEMLAALHRRGVRLAAVTSRSKRTSVHTLELAGIHEHFDAIVSAEDVPAMKPDPAPLHHALSALGIAPGVAAMAGDTTHDIEAGRAAGTLTIGVTYGFHGAAIARAKPDVLVASVAELQAALLGDVLPPAHR